MTAVTVTDILLADEGLRWDRQAGVTLGLLAAAGAFVLFMLKIRRHAGS